MNRLMLVAIISACLILVGETGLRLRSWASHSSEKKSLHEVAPTARASYVTLTDDEMTVAGIEVNPVTKRELHPHRTVPGRIDYDATRHVEIKAPFDGLIRSIDVKVGERVTEAQIIALVDSPELGEKRADVLLRKSDLEQAKNEHEWWHAIEMNLQDLMARLKRSQEVLEVAKDFENKPLGDYRQQVLSAYAQMRLDERLNDSVSNSKDGAFAGKVKLERELARDNSTAKFIGTCEQATFEVHQKHLIAEAAMKDSEQRLAVAKQRLGLLVNQSEDEIAEVVKESSLSTWPVKVPFTATVEEVLLAPKERIPIGQGLFILADTSHLWVQADIREREWSALSIKPGQTVLVQAPALPGTTMEATVAFVGRTVSAETRAVPLTAVIDNQKGLLKPGMFVRVLIPDAPARECLAVSESAVVSNNGRSFVFIEAGPREYYPRDVKTGINIGPWIEIKSGLKLDERVVTSGSATLKAELLLERDD